MFALPSVRLVRRYCITDHSLIYQPQNTVYSRSRPIMHRVKTRCIYKLRKSITYGSSKILPLIDNAPTLVSESAIGFSARFMGASL